MIKLVGLIFIILSSSGLGYVLGTRFSMRVRELKLLKVALQMLETEIVYSNTPLPQAFESIQWRTSKPVNELFKMMSSNLNKKIYGTVGEAFSSAIDGVKEKMALEKDDIEILKSFGYSIGNSDVEGQVKSFKMILKQLDSQEIKAEESRNKSERMYKNLGLLTGIAIAILLL